MCLVNFVYWLTLLSTSCRKYEMPTFLFLKGQPNGNKSFSVGQESCRNSGLVLCASTCQYSRAYLRAGDFVKIQIPGVYPQRFLFSGSGWDQRF